MNAFDIMYGNRLLKNNKPKEKHNMDFWDTQAGLDFARCTVPTLIEAIESMTKSMEQLHNDMNALTDKIENLEGQVKEQTEDEMER